MSDGNDNMKIAAFLAARMPLIAQRVKGLLLSLGCQVEEEGNGLSLVFTIDVGEGKVKFFLKNLFLEIATIDRDENPLRFDERLADFDFFLSKMADHVCSKVRVLFHLREEKDVEKAIKRIERDAPAYERVRIIRIDDTRKPPS